MRIRINFIELMLYKFKFLTQNHFFFKYIIIRLFNRNHTFQVLIQSHTFIKI
jgi:hypothetical protein